MKKGITNISSVVIICRESDPSQIFIEVKDHTHPLLLVREGMCLIGGNWIGEAAAKDRGPLDTVRREISEELTLVGKEVSTEELVKLGLVDLSQSYIVGTKVESNEIDQMALKTLVGVIKEKLVSFGSYLNTTTREAILSADPNSTRDGFTTLCCYWCCGLNDQEWEDLSCLQSRYGNLSNESITTIVSLKEIIRRDMTGAFCHEQVLRDFFLAMNIDDAKKMRIVKHQKSVFVGPILETYGEYLERYDVARHP